VMILVRNRHDPKYKELVKELEDEIEGWIWIAIRIGDHKQIIRIQTGL
jgi:hypothetical protein